MADTKVPDGWYRTTLGKVAKLTMGQSPASDTTLNMMDYLFFKERLILALDIQKLGTGAVLQQRL